MRSHKDLHLFPKRDLIVRDQNYLNIFKKIFIKDLDP